MPNNNVAGLRMAPNNVAKTAEMPMPQTESQTGQTLPKPEVEAAPVAQVANNNQTVTTPVPVVQNNNTVVQSQNVHTDSSTARDLHLQSLQNLPAEDSDLIEKVWVDQIEKTIDTTKDDPYIEDEQQHHLSRTYLKKRFNLDVK